MTVALALTWQARERARNLNATMSTPWGDLEGCYKMTRDDIKDDMKIERIYIDQVAVAHALTCGMRLGSARARPLRRVAVAEHGLSRRLLQWFARARSTA